MKKTNFSEKMNSFLEDKKKREDNVSALEEKKKIFFDKSNFTERRNDELAKNYEQVIAGRQVTHQTDNIAQVMKCVEAHAERRSGGTLDEENESNEQYNQENGRETPRKDTKTGYNNATDIVNIEGNCHTEQTISQESSGLNEGYTSKHSLHNAINNPIEKMKKLRIKSTHRYLNKAEDDSYKLIKDYHREVDNCMEEIKSETFLKANLLKSEMDKILTQAERLTKEALDLKWDGNPSPREENSQGQMKINNFYLTYYTTLMELKVREKFIPSSDNAVDGPQMSSTRVIKDCSENTKKCILNEIKKEVDKKREDMKAKWECVQNLFTNLNEKIKNFICHFERKHEKVIKGMSDSTQCLEAKMREKIFFSTEEASQIINTEMERGKQFFLDFLTHFNDYVTKTYNYVYEKYHRCEYIFLSDMLHQQSYQDICCVYSTISQNYLNSLSTNKIFNRLITMFEDNYNAVYARRVGLPSDQFFNGFLSPQRGELTEGEAAKHDQRHSTDIYQNANQHYEEYLKRYEEIKTEMMLYREAMLHTLFHLGNFAAAVGGGTATSTTTTTATAGGRQLCREATKKAAHNVSTKTLKKAQRDGKEKKADSNPVGDNLEPKRELHVKVKMENYSQEEPSIGKNPKEGNPLPDEVNRMVDDPSGVTHENDNQTDEIIIAQIFKNKNVFKKITNKILTHYNILNLRDDYFLLSFFSILETLKSDILLMSSHVERKINQSVQQCSEKNSMFLYTFDTLLREYNSVVKKCLQCKDHLLMKKLLTIKDEAKKKLQSHVIQTEEESRTINETLCAQSQRLWGDFLFAALTKAKVISAEGEEALSLRRANERCGINETAGEGKHTDDIKGKQKIKTHDNERNIIRQLVGPKHTYTYDAEMIWYHAYTTYKSNMMGLLHPSRDIAAGLERNVKRKERTVGQTGKNASNAAKKKESTIKTNIEQIRKEYIQQSGEVKGGGNHFDEEEVNPDGTHSVATTNALPQVPKICPPDELLFNEDLLKELFQNFTSTYYERFKEILFEHLLKAKMRSEKECTKWCQKIEAHMFEEQIQRDEEKMKELAIKLEEKFKANKKTFDNASIKLSQLVKEYEHVINEEWEDYEHFKKNICMMEKILEQNTDDHEYDKFTIRYNQLMETLKISFKSIREKLLYGEKKLKGEIKKVQTYCTMLIRTGQTNVDMDEIQTFLHNSNNLLLSICQKRQEIENVFNANEYIFNNKFRAISCRSSNRGEGQSGPATPAPDRQMIDYLITKEEIKNNLLIFYLLVYHIRVCIGQSTGLSVSGVPYPEERKARHPAYTSKASLKMERSPKDAHNGKGESNPASPFNLVSPVNGGNFSNATTPRTHQIINLQDKFTLVQNCIYEIGTFRKIEKRYELDLPRKDSIVTNFFLSRMISPHLPHLVFSKATGMHESPDDYLTFGLVDNEARRKGKEAEQEQQRGVKGIEQMGKQPAPAGSSCETVAPQKCAPKPDTGAEHETCTSDTKTNVRSTQRITHTGMKIKQNSKKSESNIVKDNPPDASSYAENEIIRKDYLDVKFFLYTCVYIIHLISNVVQKTRSKDFPKERQPKYHHFLFISYDLSHIIYKNNILADNVKSKKAAVTDLMVNKKAMSSFVFCPDHVSRRTELIHLFKFEKETVSELFERTFAQLRALHSASANDILVGKIHSEYAEDIYTLATYLKVLLKKAAYFTFRCIYKRHESMCTERINTMQKNLLKKFKELNEDLKVTDTGEDTASHVTKRKQAIKSLFHSYVSVIRGMLTNHLMYLHDNLCNNVIFCVHVLSLLPAGSFSSGDTPLGRDSPPEKASTQGAGNLAFLKIHHVDISAEYDLSDIVKKIDKAYGAAGDHSKVDSGAKQKKDAEIFYLPYNEENLYIAKKLEQKMNKYGERLYAHMAKAMDEKKKEIIKIISNDVKEHRRYYE
ncbi:hypothetical protein AK88_04462 [Plasmodium fragile]|uniref:Uncharacterized protein n=1 Tax=Plasmodium fragile TaxID=5857 RepID=A0A0D9QFP8_PLAFR|nr:uncharacterized protein AK88_04462 [Plasmodium fragile]KJP85875.1 hypothetical protein AK88_04462 [Plasmodium fragile]